MEEYIIGISFSLAALYAAKKCIDYYRKDLLPEAIKIFRWASRELEKEGLERKLEDGKK